MIEDTQIKNIKIDSISQDTVQFGIKTTLVSGGDKYSFFNTKKDGDKTKAQEQYEKHNFKVGDTVSISVKEEEKTFTNQEQKEITFTQRTILWFGDGIIVPDPQANYSGTAFAGKAPEMPVLTQELPRPIVSNAPEILNSPETIIPRLRELLEIIKRIERKVDSLDVPRSSGDATDEIPVHEEQPGDKEPSPYYPHDDY